MVYRRGMASNPTKGIGIGAILLGCASALGQMQNLSFAEKLFADSGLKPVFAHLPPWTPTALTFAFFVFLFTWLILKVREAMLTTVLIAPAEGPTPTTNLPQAIPPIQEKPDFRVSINNVTIDARTDNPGVLADITVTNYGGSFAIDKWQMLYWRNGQRREAGKQELQHHGYTLEEYRIEARWNQPWGFDDYIGRQTATPFAKGERRRGFFWAELTDSPKISIEDLRTIYLQFESEGRTFESPRAGAAAVWGQITIK